MHPKNLRIEDYAYPLPDDRVARYPLPERDTSKLLIYKEGIITEDIYKNIADQIPSNSLLVFNQTRVVNARLLFKKPSGGAIEVFCLAPDVQYADIQTAMLQKQKVVWECLVGGAGKWKQGMVLQLTNEQPHFTLSASIISRNASAFSLSLEWDNEALSFAEILHFAGKIPLPPYLNREAEAGDETTYQTTYARDEGSVAAPTAGLHFTEAIFNALEAKNIQATYVTLHVGAGTFKPVKAATMAEHDMHAEWIDVDRTAIIDLINNQRKNLVAVGTTSLRTLESLYWIGCKLINGEQIDWQGIAVNQWDPYEISCNCTTPVALEALLHYLDKNSISKLITRTRILIAPGYKFRIVNALVTNFHQPQSTLLLLVAALIGTDWRRVYDYALAHDFGFLSYGDGGLLWGKASLGI